MSQRNTYNRFQPPIAGLTPEPIACLFCGDTDLRIGGTDRETYLCCTRCGAEGPRAEGLVGAVAFYTKTPVPAPSLKPRARPFT